MKSLKAARDEGKLDEFVAEHEADGDEGLFSATLASMAGTSKAVPEASCEPLPDDCNDTQIP